MPTTPFRIDTPAMSQHDIDFEDSDDNEELENQVFVENLVDDMVARLAVDSSSPRASKLLMPQSISMYTQERIHQRRLTTLGADSGPPPPLNPEMQSLSGSAGNSIEEGYDLDEEGEMIMMGRNRSLGLQN
jgi:hypothetical protein